uniref:Tektin n=1 Tax=Bursaphelenchus xylophilus TaxID=6326 RepID=A0A1I7SME0_BURXY
MQVATKEDYDDPAEVLRVARLAVKEANNRAMRLQNATTQQLVQRVKDLKYWSSEIDRELQDLKDDNEDIVRYFRKLSSCQVVTQDAVKCNEACFAVRRKRIHVDSHDRVDSALGKEKEVIHDCIKQMKEFNAIVEKQLEINDQSKNRLLRDYTLKQEAVNLDHRAAAFGADPRYVGKRAQPGEVDYRDTVPLQRMSDYQEWIENTAVNLNNSSKARAKSRKIVQKLINSTREFAQAMRQEAINVENTLKDSIRNWTEWRDSLQAQLKDKDKEVKVADAAINEIQYSLQLNGSPLQVSQI